MNTPTASRRILLLGSTGTIGQATLRRLLQQGHQVVCLVRDGGAGAGRHPSAAPAARIPTAIAALCADRPGALDVRAVDLLDPGSLRRLGIRGERFDALISCMASRTGDARDAWRVDHDAHVRVLEAARESGISQMVLLSAICVQRPMLAFQQAKLAFERALIDSGLNHSIVRPTAFFKSLSGQFERVRQGKPFLIFGQGDLTACKPIGDEDLADYIVGCLDDPQRQGRILPIGGPGPALTPLQQGHALFEVLGLAPRFKRVPVAVLDGIIATLQTFGHLFPAAARKAEFARIGRYYATESMLVWDPERGRYSEEATPSFGQQTLRDHYRDMASGRMGDQRGAHAVF